MDNKQVEAHWGLILCKYGVEYVDDPKTKKKVPTCHRTRDYSIFTDSDYKIIKKHSYGDALALYEAEAKQIDDIQKGILKISSKEKPYDVFICYKETDNNGERTHDSVIAQDIYDKLTSVGLKVFFARITLENKLGVEYEPYIYSALKSSKVMLVVGTDIDNFNAVWVKNEWRRYLEMMETDKGKTLIPVYSKIDAYKLPEEFAMLQAQSMDKVGAIQDLTRGVKKIVDEYKNVEVDDIDAETVAKVQKALEESRSVGNGQYEVNIVKENLPVWYYILCIVTIFFYSFFKLIVIAVCNPVSLLTFERVSFSYNKELFIVSLLYILFLASYVACLFIHRKTHKIAKKFLPFLIFALTIKFALYLNSYLVPGKISYFILDYGLDIAVLLVSYFIVPKWNLNMSSKSIMNAEERDKQIIKNNYLREHYKAKEKNKDNRFTKRVPIILLIIIVIIYALIALKIWNRLPYRQSNGKDSSVNQIYVLGHKKIYASDNLDSKILASVRGGDYYDILDFDELKQSDDLSFYGFAKIKTNKGIEGYLYLGEKNYNHYNGYDYEIICGEDDEECSSKFHYSNSRDTSVNQVEVITETLNIRKDHSKNSSSLAVAKEGDIFTINDTYIEEITETRWNDDIFSDNFGSYKVVVEKRNWYKVTTSNGIEGWVCASAASDVYLKYLSAN